MQAERRDSLEVQDTISAPDMFAQERSQKQGPINISVNPVNLEQDQEQQTAPSGRDGPEEKQSAWVQFLNWLDAYQVEERKPDRVGLIVTFVVIPLAIAYCVVVAFQMMNAPNPVKTEVLWAASEGPFQMPIRCEVQSGCLLSNTYGGENPECIAMAHKEERDVWIAYSDDFLDGPSVLAEAAAITTPIVTVLSEGTVQMTYVHTENKTLDNSGREREEYFNVQMNTDGAVMPGSTSCESQIVEGMAQLRMRIHPAITMIVVTPGFSWWTYFGVCSGQYAALLSWGALVVATYDTMRG